MKQTKIWVEELLKALALKPAKISALFDELVYGKPAVCMRNRRRQPIVLYLNEDVPEMLVGVAEGGRDLYLNLREAQTILSSPSLELELKVAQNQYVVLKSESDELVLLFEGGAGRAQRESFLQFLRFYVGQLAKSPFEVESLLLYTFITVDRNQNMTLEPSEIRLLLSRMRMHENEQFASIVRYVRKEEEGEDGLGGGEITFTEFEKIMKLMQCRTEFKALFERLAMRKLKSYKLYMEKLLPIKAFVDFLREEQFESGEMSFSKEQRISFYDFSRFLMSRYAQVYDEALEGTEGTEGEGESLEHPLTSYYCFSSHNTYLTGNQLTSDSKAERYREDLENGYRCLEIDVHNGSSGPIVKHGFTMTAAVPFEEVVQTIARFSDEHPRHTPIILSLENHASEEQQLQMCTILRTAFGEKILTILPHLSATAFPTLQALLGKIVIKNSGSFLQYQLVTEGAIAPAMASGGSSDEEGEEAEKPSLLARAEEYPVEAQEQLRQFSDLQKRLQNGKREFLRSQGVFRKFIGRRSSELVVQEIRKKVHPELLKLTSILGKGSLKKPCIWESVSLSEGSIQNYFLTDHAFLKEWTQMRWVRAYPSSSRVDSSNYNPIPALELGVQLPAINSQSADHFTAVLRLFFRKNRNRCTGYRLKPAGEGQAAREVRIRPVSGSMLSPLVETGSIPEVQVKMSFLGCAYDMFQNQAHIKMEAFTERVKDNAYNPVFEGARVMQLRIAKPEFAFLLLEVEQCGKGVIAVEGLKRGYRHVPLLDHSLQERKAKIFFKID